MSLLYDIIYIYIYIFEQEYPTVEHFWQASKFITVDSEYAERIRATSMEEALILANSPSIKIRDDWDDVKYNIALEGSLYLYRWCR